MDLDAPFRRWCCRKAIPIACSTTAIEDGHTEGIHVAWSERSGPSIYRELTGRASIEGSRSLDLGARLAGHHQEIEAGALEVDVSGIVMELHVSGRSCGVGEIFDTEPESDRTGARRVRGVGARG